MHVCNVMAFFFCVCDCDSHALVTKADTAHFAPGADDILAEHSLGWGRFILYYAQGITTPGLAKQKEAWGLGQLCSIDSNGYRKDGRT